jgi:hypothetical protein
VSAAAELTSTTWPRRAASIPGQDGADGVQRPEQVERHLPLQRGGVHLQQPARLRAARRGHQHVARPEAPDRLVQRRLVGHVG